MLPNNASVTIDENFALSDGTNGLRTTFNVDGIYRNSLKDYSVTVIADSLLPGTTNDTPDSGNRITTVVAKFPRPILAEVNTHRVFSRNSASSRARSIKVVIADVMENPYIPLFTENRRGMTGEFLSETDQAAATAYWLESRDSMVASVLSMLRGEHITVDQLRSNWEELTDDYYQRVYLAEEKLPNSLNLHKQNVNRLLEPYMWHEAVITSTYWENFKNLRDEYDADPAIHGFAKLLVNALEASVPLETDTHAPFARHIAPAGSILANPELQVEAVNYSSGAAAQTSYRPVVGGSGTGADPAKLATRLLAMTHLSPFEHGAFERESFEKNTGKVYNGSNFADGWLQYRQVVAG